MKKTFAVSLYVLMSFAGYSQHLTVPPAVMTVFQSMFPNAANVKWGKENATEYEAEFKQNNTAISANFKTNGTWVETETTIPAADLPAAVTAALHTKYPGAEITRAEKLEKPGNKILYETVLIVKGKRKELALNGDGSFAQ